MPNFLFANKNLILYLSSKYEREALRIPITSMETKVDKQDITYGGYLLVSLKITKQIQSKQTFQGFQ